VVESYEAAPVNAGAMRDRAIEEMKRLVAKLNLEDELTANMAGELEVRGLSSFEQVDDDLLVHEIGHYLTTLQEDFMPLGLHVFGRDWSEQAVQTMLTSMNNGKQATESWDPLLRGSPAAEMSA
ncbi:cobaltochelatase subunit CobN, partial [Methylophaga sp. UBA3996]